MATKKTEEVVTPDVSMMNVWAKLLAVRNEFYAAGAKKTGKNLHAEFKYFELEDIVPVAAPIFKKYGLLLIPVFGGDFATALIVNIDRPEEVIRFTIPFVLISEPGKFRMNEVQGMGAAVTYYRRYLYMVVLDLVESDGIDCQDGGKNEAPKKPVKPVTTEERKAIKEELTSEDKPASAAQIKELKGLLKKLMELDPEQEEFVQSVAIKTDGFKKLTVSRYENLLRGLTDMLKEYEA